MNSDQVDSNHFSLSELLDVSVFQNLLDSFFQLTGLPTALLNIEGKILIASGWQEICTKFHRKNPDTAKRCIESDTVLANQIAAGQSYNIYQCKNGLFDVAAPIIIENQHVGNLFAGQFLFEQPDIDFFTRQAREFRFDQKAYLAALSKVPVLSDHSVKTAIQFLADLTGVIARTVMDKIKISKYSKNLEEQVQLRTADLHAEIKTRKKAEAELQANKDFLESVFNSIQDGIVVLNRDLNVIRMNKTMKEWYPDAEQSIGKKCHEMFRECSEACENCPGIRTFQTRNVEMSEVSVHLADGTLRTLEQYAFPITSDSGELTGIVEYKRDITAKKEIEKQIILEKTFSESLINSLPGIMYVFDQFGHFERWNQNFETVSGYSRNQIKDMNPLDFIAVEDKPRVKNTIDQVLTEGSSTVEAGFATLDGKIIPYLFTGYLYERNGIKYLIGVGLNISDRVKAENEKLNLISRLQDALAQAKQLSGLLPICSSCKKIRDDTGYWNQLETYLAQHTEAQFSHGMCPECADRLYGKESWYRKNKKKKDD